MIIIYMMLNQSESFAFSQKEQNFIGYNLGELIQNHPFHCKRRSYIKVFNTFPHIMILFKCNRNRRMRRIQNTFFTHASVLIRNDLVFDIKIGLIQKLP
jgi:hypothetical protein